MREQIQPVGSGASDAPERGSDGKYEVAPGVHQWAPLGTGQRFEMWLGWSVERWSPVTVKIPRLDVLTDRTRAALAREAAYVGRLSHPHIQRLFEAQLDVERPYLVYEYVEGPTLRSTLKKNGAVDPATVTILGMQLAAILHYVHRSGLVHLDVKPGNLVERGGRIVLLDFDIALEKGEVRSTTHPRGTHAYMAPEQIRCEPAAPSMDLFALGIVLYKCATGTAPFPTSKDDHGHRIYPQLSGPPTPIRELAPHVNEPLETVINALLEPDPADRPQSAVEVLPMLASALPEGERPLWPDWAGRFLP